jgi:hypothetical protein
MQQLRNGSSVEHRLIEGDINCFHAVHIQHLDHN